MHPGTVIQTMRTILRRQVTDNSMDGDVVRFIFDRGLLRQTEWPSWLISLTDAGSAYIRDEAEHDVDC